MTNLFQKYETDPEKELGGIPVELDGCTFTVRRAGGGNRAYRYALALAARQFQHVFKAEVRDEQAVFQANEEIQQIAFAQTVLVGWENVDGRDGLPLEFSKEAALDLIQSCPAVWDALKGAAIEDSNFKPQADGEELGKL